MVSPNTDLLTEEWERVRHWPDEQRQELVARLLRSLGQSPTNAKPNVSPSQLIGAWAVPSPPSDADVDRMLDEERSQKCG